VTFPRRNSELLFGTFEEVINTCLPQIYSCSYGISSTFGRLEMSSGAQK